MHIRAASVFATLALMTACIGLPRKADRAPSSVAAVTATPDEAFLVVHKIATSNRCTNCHSKGERPMNGSGSAQIQHPMNIQRSFNKLGGACTSCHQSRNFAGEHMPPGAEAWRMPTKMKGYDSSASPAELCQIWTSGKNVFEEGARMGQQRKPHELLEHVSHDPLVIWSFNPGPGREPALAGPGAHEVFVAYVKQWVEGGAPCPAR